MNKIISFVRKGIIYTMMVLLLIVLIISLFEAIYSIAINLLYEQSSFGIQNLLELFSVFIVMLIGLELLEIVKIYLKRNELHVEMVLLIIIMVFSRKLMVWDFTGASHLEMVALAVMMAVVIAGYFIIKRNEPSDKRIEHKDEMHKEHL